MNHAPGHSPRGPADREAAKEPDSLGRGPPGASRKVRGASAALGLWVMVVAAPATQGGGLGSQDPRQGFRPSLPWHPPDNKQEAALGWPSAAACASRPPGLNLCPLWSVKGQPGHGLPA